jgi:vacuolar protein sorting-associated protein 54
LLTKELITKKTHSKLISDLNDTLSNASDYAQERIVNLLESKFRDNSLEKLSANDFISISNLIEQFVLDFDTIASKKTVSLRSWLKNQANKYLQKFHQEKREKLT